MKIFKNRKGFTLAVIVILAIILLIAVPQVTKIINKATADSFISSYKMVLKQMDIYAMEGTLTGDKIGDTSTPALLANYDLNDDNYDLTIVLVSGQTNKYTVILTGKGKFASVDFSDVTDNCSTINVDLISGDSSQCITGSHLIRGDYTVSAE